MPTPAFVLGLQLSASPVPPPPVSLLQPGLYASEEVRAPLGDQGPGWFALVVSLEGGARLQATAVTVAAVPHPLDRSESAREVLTPGLEDAVILLRGLPAMKAGPVPSTGLLPSVVRLGAPVSLPALAQSGLPPGAVSRLQLVSGAPGPARLFFEGGSATAPRRQELLRAEDEPYLHWAGDLDGDGRIDLLLSAERAEPHPVTRLELYLSGRAAADDLVGLAAALVFGGC